MSEEFWCTKCLRCYKTKHIFFTHFEKKNVTYQSGEGTDKRGGRLVPNECFQSIQREFANTRSAAELIQKQIQKGALSKFFQVGKKRRQDDSSDLNIPSSSQDLDDSGSSLAENVTQTEASPHDTYPNRIEQMEVSDTVSNQDQEDLNTEVGPETSSAEITLETINGQLKMMELQHQQIMEMMEQLNMGSKNQTKEPCKEKAEQQMLEKKDFIDRNTASALTYAKSMKDIMLNPLVNDRFHFVPLNYYTDAVRKEEYSEDELGSECYLLCKICLSDSSRCGMLVVDRKYSCNYFENFSPWFTRLKKVLRRHISDVPMHQAAVKKLEKREKEYGDTLAGIKSNLRYLVYYIIKTNIAFLNYPALLSTVSHCGLEIGNINHSRDFVSRILPLIDGILLENTKEWISDQQHITISLDIGTVLGAHITARHESKQWRTGLAYTQLRLETLDFMRPKLFSSTRMCLYEFDQVKRFIEISHYFDVPWHWEVMCRLYILILFAEKIILKTCQKTNDQREYVARVFMRNPEPEGKKAMVLGLRVAKDVIRSQPIRYLDTENLVDVLSTEPNVNNFVREMKKLVAELGLKLVPSSLQNTRGGTRAVQAITLPVIEAALETFINQFWDQFAVRAARTDLTSGETWSFSEAPCEAFFSKWGRIVDSRPSLLVENVVRLIRVQLEGPPAGTDEAHSLMEAAMKQYRTVSHLGERYTTQNWVPGVVSTTVQNVMNSPWTYSVYSNF
ncbi:hypothetical protein ACHWQZ_G004702 [Mnemiopsis leidyi]